MVKRTQVPSGERCHLGRPSPFPKFHRIRSKAFFLPAESTYCLLALHHQLVHLIELADNSLSLRKEKISLEVSFRFGINLDGEHRDKASSISRSHWAECL